MKLYYLLFLNLFIITTIADPSNCWDNDDLKNVECFPEILETAIPKLPKTTREHLIQQLRQRATSNAPYSVIQFFDEAVVEILRLVKEAGATRKDQAKVEESLKFVKWKIWQRYGKKDHGMAVKNWSRIFS